MYNQISNIKYQISNIHNQISTIYYLYLSYDELPYAFPFYLPCAGWMLLQTEHVSYVICIGYITHIVHRILAAYPQYHKATARTVRAKREHHGPVRLLSCLLEAVFM